jgi:hypothetical protein
MEYDEETVKRKVDVEFQKENESREVGSGKL